MQSQDLAPVLVLLSFMIGAAWIVWVVSNNRRCRHLTPVGYNDEYADQVRDVICSMV